MTGRYGVERSLIGVDAVLHGFVAIVIGCEKILVIVCIAGIHEVLDVFRPHPVQRFSNGLEGARIAEVACGDNQLASEYGRLVITIGVARFEEQEMA